MLVGCRRLKLSTAFSQEYGSKVVLYKRNKTFGNYRRISSFTKKQAKRESCNKKKENLEERIIIHQKVYSNTLPVGLEKGFPTWENQYFWQVVPKVKMFSAHKLLNVSFKFKRLQFPVRLSFSIRINKEKGDSLTAAKINCFFFFVSYFGIGSSKYWFIFIFRGKKN